MRQSARGHSEQLRIEIPSQRDFVMTKLQVFFFAAVVGSSFSLSAVAAAQNSTPEAKDYYYWLHPKLGMVKVDRQTHAMVTSGKRAHTGADRPARAELLFR